jgi:hypothetical protein
MTPQEIGWVAGLVEATAALRILRHRRRDDTVALRFLIQVELADEDLIERLWNITGVGEFDGPHASADIPTWRWEVRVRAEVRQILQDIRPLMSIRRQSEIDGILNEGAKRGGPSA